MRILSGALVRLAAGLLLFCTMCSCSLRQKWQDRRAADAKAKEQAKAQAEAIQMFDWKGDTLTGAMAVKIVLGDQKAYLYRGGQEAGWTYLASGTAGLHVIDVTAPQTPTLLATLATSGMYQNAGEFAWRVGLPAKSGVGGGVVAIVPHEMAIAVWSPELDETGNSLAGVAVLEKLTQRLGRSVY